MPPALPGRRLAGSNWAVRCPAVSAVFRGCCWLEHPAPQPRLLPAVSPMAWSGGGGAGG